MIDVIYVYPTGHFSGAAVSMVQVLKSLAGEVRPTFLTPRGSASAYFERQALGPVHTTTWLSQFDHTRYGRYRGARWLIALRELLLLPLTWWAVRRFARSAGAAKVIHLNEITGILPAVMLKRRLDVPLVAHVRAHMGNQEPGLRSNFLWRRLFDRHVDQVVCIDETVRATLPRDLRSPVAVVHNALDMKAGRGPAREPLPEAIENPGGRLRVGIVGSLLPVKGVHEFLAAAIELCARRDDIVFVFVGAGVRRLDGLKGALFSMLGLAEDTEALIRQGIAHAGLEKRILMAGHREDLDHVYRQLDILCFPSHYNAPGRPIFEAAYFGKPSIVAIENPRPDTLIDGQTGLAIAARDPVALARAIERLADDPAAREAMGRAAQALAQRNFDLDSNAAQILAIYRRLGSPSTTEKS